MNWKYSMALHFQNLNVCNNIGSLYAPRRMQYNAECWECLQLPGMSPRSFWGDDSSKNTSTNTTLTTLIQCNPKCFTKCIKIQQTLSLHATGCGTSVALRCSTTWFRSWSWLCPWEMVWNVYMVHEKNTFRGQQWVKICRSIKCFAKERLQTWWESDLKRT